MYDAVAAPGGGRGNVPPQNTNFLKLSYFLLLDYINFKFINFKFSVNYSKFFLKTFKISIKFTKFFQTLANFSQITIQYIKIVIYFYKL